MQARNTENGQNKRKQEYGYAQLRISLYWIVDTYKNITHKRPLIACVL